MINDNTTMTAPSATASRSPGRILTGLTVAGFSIASLFAVALFATPAQGAVATRPGMAISGPEFGAPYTRAGFPTDHFFAPSIANQAAKNNVLYGVSCVTWSRCVAVGARVAGSALDFRPLAELWTGTRWQVMPTPAPTKLPRSLLAEISCQSRRDCVAVGYHYSAGGSGYALLAEHWNGQHWRIIQSVNPAGLQSAFFNGVTCAPKVGCIAVGGHSTRSGQGQGLVERWIGGHWHLMRLRWPAGARATELNGVSCYSGRCVAVGMYEDASGQQVLPLAERWTGRYWRLMRPAGSQASISILSDVSCGGPSTCMAVGVSEWAREFPLAEVWRNGRWQTVPGGKMAGGALGGVSCQVSTWCMAVGAAGNRPLTEAWFGVDWQVTQTPAISGRPPAGQLNQLSCRTGDGRCVTVGNRYSPGQTTGQATLAEWWNGNTWRLMSPRNP
jgi:hypothetical protein